MINRFCAAHLVDEAGLAYVGVSTQQQGPGVRVDARQTGQMLTNCLGSEPEDLAKDPPERTAGHRSPLTLLQVLQTGLLPLQDGAHPTQSSSLQLFAPVHGVSVLHQTHVIFGNTGRVKKRRLQNKSLWESPAGWLFMHKCIFDYI